LILKRFIDVPLGTSTTAIRPFPRLCYKLPRLSSRKNCSRGGTEMKVGLILAALMAALAFSSPAFATDNTMMMGHHACASGGKKGNCTHHYMGHHTTMSGGKKGSSMHMGHHASPSGDKKSGSM
jgi:hypothetical protein